MTHWQENGDPVDRAWCLLHSVVRRWLLKVFADICGNSYLVISWHERQPHMFACCWVKGAVGVKSWIRERRGGVPPEEWLCSSLYQQSQVVYVDWKAFHTKCTPSAACEYLSVVDGNASKAQQIKKLSLVGQDCNLSLLRRLRQGIKSWKNFWAVETGAFLNSQLLRLHGQDQINQYSIPVWGAHLSTSLAEQLLATDGFCGEVEPNSLRVWLLVDQPCSSAWLHTQKEMSIQNSINGAPKQKKKRTEVKRDRKEQR